ncbi:MAG: TIM barrel protein [Candidatus Nanoarchaeia archaeon]
MGDYHIEDIYQGGYSSLDSNSGMYYKGGRPNAGQFGMATDPRVANILSEVSTKLQSGAKEIEISAIQPDVFESIPNQQLTEVKRLSKLTGVDISLHGILVEPSGFSTQGGYSEYAREEAERQLLSNVRRGHELSPEGNIPITFHSSNGWAGPEYKKTKKEEQIVMIPVINQETGQVAAARQETLYYPRMNQEELNAGYEVSAKDQVEIRNSTEWNDSISNLVAIKERADRMIGETEPIFYEIQKKLSSGIKPENLTPTERDTYSRYNNAGLELHEIHKHLNNIFEKGYKYGDKEVMIKISDDFRKSLKENEGAGLSGESRAIDRLMRGLSSAPVPEIYKPLEDFAIDKTAITFANVALNSYKEFKNTAPIISIENPPAGGGLSRAEDLKRLVDTARDKFVEGAKQSGINEKEAREQANKLIGVTWDVGHINMIRKYGYNEEDIIKESEKVAPFVKHIHLSDNFGFEHTELPMGMGNVPIKQIMEKLGEKGFEARKVIEAGNWWQHFKTSPFQETLEAFGSPIYGMKMAPYWNQSVGVQGYFGGYGQMLPQGNYETMGSGFSSLPVELGGQKQTGRSRMSGTPME